MEQLRECNLGDNLSRWEQWSSSSFLLFPPTLYRKKKGRIETAHVNVIPVSALTPLPVFNSFPQLLSLLVTSQGFAAIRIQLERLGSLLVCVSKYRATPPRGADDPALIPCARSSPPPLSLPLKMDETGAVKTKCASKSSINLVQDFPLSWHLPPPSHLLTLLPPLSARCSPASFYPSSSSMYTELCLQTISFYPHILAFILQMCGVVWCVAELPTPRIISLFWAALRWQVCNANRKKNTGRWKNDSQVFCIPRTSLDGGVNGGPRRLNGRNATVILSSHTKSTLVGFFSHYFDKAVGRRSGQRCGREERRREPCGEEEEKKKLKTGTERERERQCVRSPQI